ncbi:MAK10-like protein [Tanacetum coccineum]
MVAALKAIVTPLLNVVTPSGLDSEGVREVEVHVGRLKLLEDFYVLDMEKDPMCQFLVGRGFLATACAIIDCEKSKIVAGEGYIRKTLEFLGAIPINLMGNKWETQDMFDDDWCWEKPPKEGDDGGILR